MSKLDEAANKLYEAFYALNLNEIYKKEPTSAKIIDYVQDPEYDQGWGVKDNELQIGMMGETIESSTEYVLANFIYLSCLYDKKNFISRNLILIELGLFIIPILLAVGIFFLSIIHFGLGIGLLALEIGALFFVHRKIRKWKQKRKEKYFDALKQKGIDIKAKQMEKEYTHIPTLYAYELPIFIIFSWIVVGVSLLVILIGSGLI